MECSNDVGRQGPAGLNPICGGAEELHHAERTVDRVCRLDHLCH
jgi:hypothetical protein